MTHGPGKRSSDDITGLLLQWSRGDADALDRLMPVIYEECRRIAAQQIRRDDRDHTLDPTAVVHELYLRLIDQRRATWQNRAHFFAIAAQIMRRILVDYARQRGAQKRGGSALLVSLDAAGDTPNVSRAENVVAIDDALERLAAIDADQVRIIELRFFAGLTVDDTALVVGRSPRTVKREWQLEKAWLHRELHPAAKQN